MNPQQFIKDLIDEGYTREEAIKMAKVEMKRQREVFNKSKDKTWSKRIDRFNPPDGFTINKKDGRK